MAAAELPDDYPQWRTNASDRAEDAAYTFGYHVIVHCRDEAMATVAADASQEAKATAEKAVDVALHNVMSLLEGFWPLPSGAAHSVEYVLQVKVLDAAGEQLESVDLSPCKLDLPIGYWKWARDRAFR